MNKTFANFPNFILSRPLLTLFSVVLLLPWIIATSALFLHPKIKNTETSNRAEPGFFSWNYWNDGWWRYSSPPKLDSIYFLTDGRHGWIAGKGGFLLATDNGGVDWKIISNDLPCFSMSVYFITASEGWAACGKSIGIDTPFETMGAIFHTENGGNSWTQQVTPEVPVLRAIFFLNNNLGWAAGNNGTILSSSDGGKTWSRSATTNPTNKTLIGVHFVSDKKGLVVGNNYEDNADDIRGRGFRDLTGQPHRFLMTTEDGGKTWLQHNTSVNFQEILHSKLKVTAPVNFVNDLKNWYRISEDKISFDTDGNNQNFGILPISYFESITSLWLTDNQSGWAISDVGGIFRSSNAGLDWQRYRIKIIGLPNWYISLSIITLSGIAFGFLGVIRKPNWDPIAAMFSSDSPIKGDEFDALESRPLAWALSRFLRHQRTEAPLTIAIDAPWGGGKTSLMNWLKEDLVRFNYHPVWFNAWHYEKQAQMFPALLETIRQQAVPTWYSFSSLRFRVRLLWHRCKESPTVAIVLFVVSCFPAGYLYANSDDVLRVTKANFTTQLENLFPKSFDSNFNKNKQDSITTAGEIKVSIDDSSSKTSDDRWLLLIISQFSWLAPLVGLWKGLESFSSPDQWLERFSSSSEQTKAKRDTATRAQFAKDFSAVTKALDMPLVIFVDDLDRCQPKNVCEVMETVNFLTTAGSCYVILGAWRDGVARAIGLGFSEAAADLANINQFRLDGRKPDKTEERRRYGQLYLEKLVNLWVRVPPQTDDTAGKLLRATTSRQNQEEKPARLSIAGWISKSKDRLTQCPASLARWWQATDLRPSRWPHILAKFGIWLFSWYVKILVLEILVFISWYPLHITRKFFKFNSNIDYQLLITLIIIWIIALPIIRKKYLPNNPPSFTWLRVLAALAAAVYFGNNVFDYGLAWTQTNNNKAEFSPNDSSGKSLGENYSNLIGSVGSKQTGSDLPVTADNREKRQNNLVATTTVLENQQRVERLSDPSLQNQYVTILGWIAVVFGFVIYELIRFGRSIPDDSPEFQNALLFWKPVLAHRFNTPRRLKRFLNYLRFNAMRLKDSRTADRTLGDDLWIRYVRGVADESTVDQPLGQESALVFLSVVDACCGDAFDFKCKLVRKEQTSSPAEKNQFTSDWEGKLSIDERLLAEQGPEWSNQLKELLLQQLRQFQESMMPLPTYEQLIQHEHKIAGRCFV